MLLLAHAVHFLIPQASNNHKARVLHPLFLTVFATIILILHFVLPTVSKLGPAVLGYAYNIPIERVVELTNKEREKKGLPALRFNQALSNSAEAKALDMFEKDYWAHNAPDGTLPWKFFSDAKYHYRYAGENLARDFSTADDAVKAWMESPTHRGNLLSQRYAEIGVAVVDGDLKGVETTLIVQHFGAQFGESVLVATPGINRSDLGTASTETSLVEMKNASTKFFASPWAILKQLSIFVLGFFVCVLLIDMIVIKKANIFRFSSKSSAHFLFLCMVLVVVLAQKAGWIL